ncbi:MAG: hypothetical protein OER43_12800 [Gammaproteobacteria bacterium]|nr:hypothetical protein [Gammaproteobacteria bacterium]
MTYNDIVDAIGETGLTPRGGFHPRADDAVPEVSPGFPCATLVLVGNAGAEMWRRFNASPERTLPVDPLNSFSQRVVGDLAERFDAKLLFPFTGPPFLPFLKWAQKAEPVWPSPIGPLIHAEYGLWHAYRGALAFSARIELPEKEAARRPCDTCTDRPCLTTCPVEAFSESGYHVPRCVAHVDSPAGSECLTGGCLARRACPVGRKYAYAAVQAEFHTRAFVEASKRRENGM